MCSVPLLLWPSPFISGRSEHGSRLCLSTEMTGFSAAWYHTQNFGFRVRTTGYKSWFCHLLALWLGQILYLLWILFPVYRMVWYNHLYLRIVFEPQRTVWEKSFSVWSTLQHQLPFMSAHLALFPGHWWKGIEYLGHFPGFFPLFHYKIPFQVLSDLLSPTSARILLVKNALNPLPAFKASEEPVCYHANWESAQLFMSSVSELPLAPI